MGQNQLDTDSFTNTAATLLTTHSANWVKTDTTLGDLVIDSVGTGLAPGASATHSSDYRTGQTWTNDQYAQFTINGITANLLNMVGVRVQTSNVLSGYFAGLSTYEETHYIITQTIATVRTVLYTTTVTPVAADVVNLQIVGTVLTLTVNSSIIGTYDTVGDVTKYATGDPGLYIYDGWGTVRSFGDDWSAGSVTTTSTAPMFRGS